MVCASDDSVKLRRPRRSGPCSKYGAQPQLIPPIDCNVDGVRTRYPTCVNFGDNMDYERPAQIRALAKWLLKVANWMIEQEKE